MRSFSKKLAFALVAAMVVSVFAPATQAKAAEDFSLNRTSYILYTSTESDNHHGSDKLADGLYGNVEKFDFNLKNAPADWATAYSYKWASSKADVATVATGGIVTAKSVGVTEISCTITDKATGNVAAKLTATVTVKANADDLEIEAADGEEYDGAEVAPGTKIDFNRTMADQDGNWSNIKGKYVTDETRWVVEPKDKGVTVDQSNGVVTVGADAAGEYTVYAETYQSALYNATTATSNKVTFTVNATNEFEITQKDLDTFEIAFEGNVTSADVEVESVLPINGVEYPIPVYAKTTLKDGVATVDLVNPVQHNQKFYFTVNGEKTPVTATIGAVTSIKVTADEKQGPDYPVVVAGTETTLKATLYNADGVNVTDYYINATSEANVEFVEVTSTEEVAYMIQQDGVIWFENAGALANIKVIFHTAVTDDNGDEVGNVEMPFQFGSVAAKKIQVENIASKTIKVNGTDTKKMTLPLNTPNAVLVVKPLVTDVKAEDTPEFIAGQEYIVNETSYGTVLMEETNNNIFAIDRGDNTIYTFQKGKGKVVIYLLTYDETAQKDVKTPVGVVDIEVTEANKLTSVKLERTSSTVGMVPGLDEDKIAFTAKDYYQQDWKEDIGTVTFKAANTAAKNLTQDEVDAALTVEEGKIVVKGSLLGKAFGTSTSNSVNPQFTVTIDNGVDKWEHTLSVVVKKEIATATPGYVLEKTAGDWGEVSRVKNNTGDANNDTKLQGAKSITFTVFETNNTVKVDGAAAKMYVDKKDLTADDNGKLFIKVTKNGTDISNKTLVEYETVDVANGNATATAVTINFSDKDADDFVTYNETGAGSYSVVLYKASVKGNVKSYSTVKTITGTTTVNVGKYDFVGVAESDAASDDWADLRACFNINGRDGKETESEIIAMDVTPSAASGTVFVRSITFVEEFEDVKVAYKVDVNKAIKTPVIE